MSVKLVCASIELWIKLTRNGQQNGLSPIGFLSLLDATVETMTKMIDSPFESFQYFLSSFLHSVSEWLTLNPVLLVSIYTCHGHLSTESHFICQGATVAKAK